MRDDMVSRKAVMDELVKEYNRKAKDGGLALAWIEKAVHPDALMAELAGKNGNLI